MNFSLSECTTCWVLIQHRLASKLSLVFESLLKIVHMQIFVKPAHSIISFSCNAKSPPPSTENFCASPISSLSETSVFVKFHLCIWYYDMLSNAHLYFAMICHFKMSFLNILNLSLDFLQCLNLISCELCHLSEAC